MAFIYLRRSRNTRSYLLIESYRDVQGRTRKRTLCYLGREQDGASTLDKSLAHWKQVREALNHELRKGWLSVSAILFTVAANDWPSR